MPPVAPVINARRPFKFINVATVATSDPSASNQALCDLEIEQSIDIECTFSRHVHTPNRAVKSSVASHHKGWLGYVSHSGYVVHFGNILASRDYVVRRNN